MLYFDDITVGSTAQTGEIEVTEGEIVRFAREWDPQPYHVDREAAARSPLGGLTAAGCHVFCLGMRLANQLKPFAVIAGLEQKLSFPNPVRPGDRLSLHSTCVDKRPSKSKPDRGIVTYDAEVRNQGGAVVLRMTSTLLLARKPDG